MTEEHLQHIVRLAQDPTLINTMGWNTFFEINETKAFIEAIAEYTFAYSCPSPPIVFGVYLDTEPLPIGYSVLKGINKKQHTAEIGVAILHQLYRPKGYGRLVLKLTVDYAFSHLNIETIGAAILESNKPSVNMCKRIGFVVKRREPWEMPDGSQKDMLLLEINKY